MSRSATPATQNYLTHPCKPPKVTSFAAIGIGWCPHYPSNYTPWQISASENWDTKTKYNLYNRTTWGSKL